METVEVRKLLTERRVGIVRTEPTYPRMPPYDPAEPFPEYRGPVAPEDNAAYRGVREVMRALGLDLRRYGTPRWNPLSEVIRRGDTVVVKPNWVCHRNCGERAYGLTDTDSLITHGSVLRAVLEYVCLALRGKGRVVIGDAPIQDTDWDALIRLASVVAISERLRERWPDINFELQDFRIERAIVRGNRIVGKERRAPGDDYVEVDLGTHSLLVPLMAEGRYSFGVAKYSDQKMKRAHTPERNLYLIPRQVLEADVFINLPKVKTHMKAGLTCALKNLVGIVGMKDYLPHFRLGSPSQGGDEYPNGNWLWDLKWQLAHKEWARDGGLLKLLLWETERICGLGLRTVFRYPRGYDSVAGGGWWGNDTLWRTILDINRALFYYDRAIGCFTPDPLRTMRYVAIADGIVSGHRESPLCPTPVKTGWVLAARNPVAMDAVVATLLGFDFRRIPQISRAFESYSFPLVLFRPEDIEVVGLPGIAKLEDIYRQRVYVACEPSRGWQGHVECGGTGEEG